MVALPPITVILQTYRRTEYALKTVAAACEKLKYHDLRWYVADDGSDESHVHAVLDKLAESGGNLAAFHSNRSGYGGNSNRAWNFASTRVSSLTFWLEDDWQLERELDLTPFARVLMDYEDVGMIRLGHLNMSVIGTAIDYNGRAYWQLERETADGASPVFTGHPSLRHDRYRFAYGSYPVGYNPGDTELQYAYRYRIAREGPSILWPAEAGQWGWFGHIGEVKSENL